MSHFTSALAVLAHPIFLTIFAFFVLFFIFLFWLSKNHHDPG